MIYRFLADLTVCFHFLFILFALFGGMLFLWRKWTIILHLPAVLWSALIEFQGWICPLTPLENRFRIAGSRAGYEGGFIEHYLIPVIYPAGLTRDIQIILGFSAILINVLIYLYVLRSIGFIRKPAVSGRED